MTWTWLALFFLGGLRWSLRAGAPGLDRRSRCPWNEARGGEAGISRMTRFLHMLGEVGDDGGEMGDGAEVDPIRSFPQLRGPIGISRCAGSTVVMLPPTSPVATQHHIFRYSLQSVWLRSWNYLCLDHCVQYCDFPSSIGRI